jgi:cytidine deaminase
MTFAYSIINGKRVMGLGDAVATVAEPIRKAARIAPCGSCKQRRATLNRAIPNILPPFLRTKGN